MQHKLSTGAATFYYTYSDHLGNVVALSNISGTFVPNSLARHDPFGNYRTTPATTVNPTLTDQGFTGHRMNNTGDFPTQNVGLIYMNARYYMPEVGRFISPDSIVPEPGEPQSYNRYSYVRNSPMNHIDPTGHMDDVGTQFGGGSANEVASFSLVPGYEYTLVAMPFAPTSSTDPRVAELKPKVCTPISGCNSIPSIVPTYLASSNSIPGSGVLRSEGQRKIGKLLSAWGTGIDVLSTTISGASLAAQIAATAAFGPTGLDDLLVHGSYPIMVDPYENASSIMAAGAVIAGDFFSGASNFSASDLQALVGQDTIFVGSTAVIGLFVGQTPIAGPLLDTGVNLAVNAYDFGRLTNRIPTIVEMRIDSSGVYVIFYP